MLQFNTDLHDASLHKCSGMVLGWEIMSHVQL